MGSASRLNGRSTRTAEGKGAARARTDRRRPVSCMCGRLDAEDITDARQSHCPRSVSSSLHRDLIRTVRIAVFGNGHDGRKFFPAIAQWREIALTDSCTRVQTRERRLDCGDTRTPACACCSPFAWRRRVDTVRCESYPIQRHGHGRVRDSQALGDEDAQENDGPHEVVRNQQALVQCVADAALNAEHHHRGSDQRQRRNEPRPRSSIERCVPRHKRGTWNQQQQIVVGPRNGRDEHRETEHQPQLRAPRGLVSWRTGAPASDRHTGDQREREARAQP